MQTIKEIKSFFKDMLSNGHKELKLKVIFYDPYFIKDNIEICYRGFDDLKEAIEILKRNHNPPIPEYFKYKYENLDCKKDITKNLCFENIIKISSESRR